MKLDLRISSSRKRLNELNFEKSQESETKEDFTALTKELMSELKSARAEISEIRNVVFQMKSKVNQETVAPKTANSNNPKKFKAKRPGPSHNLDPDGNPIPGLHLGKGTSSNRNNTENKSDQHIESEEAFHDWNVNKVMENSEDYQYVGPRKPRKKNQEKKNTPEIKLSKKEQLAAREVIIHGIPTPMGGDKFDKVKEAILIMDALDELKSKYLGKQGVDIDIEKNIVFHDRIVEHHDATRIGCQPVKVRFRKQTFCDKS